MTHPSPSRTLASVQVPTTIGIDLSDRVSHYCVMHGDGSILAEGKVASEREALARLFAEWIGCRVIIEAGGHSPWVERLGRACGMEILVANPRRLEIISKSDRKTDRNDARMLARLGRLDVEILSPITHRSESSQQDLAVLRARDALVAIRTGLINHVHGALKSHGFRAKKCSSESFERRGMPELPEALAAALGPVLKLLAQTSAQIRVLDARVKSLIEERHPVAKLLQQVTGVGPVVSLTYVLTIDDPSRFKKSRDVAAFVGLVPRKRSSGEHDPQLRITKSGDGQLRKLLVLAANFILGQFGSDCDLRRFGLRIAPNPKDRVARKRAKVAIARKLAVLLHHLWKTGEAYDPFYISRKRAEPVPA